MIQEPHNLGAVRFYHDPESLSSSHAGVTVTMFQGTTSIITDRGPYHIALGGADFEIIPTNNILPAHHLRAEQAHYISPHELVASSMAGESARKSQKRRGPSRDISPAQTTHL